MRPKFALQKWKFSENSGEVTHFGSKLVGSKWVKFCKTIICLLLSIINAIGFCDLMPVVIL